MIKKCVTASCVLVKDGKVFLLNHKKLKKWLYPGGHIDEGENPIEALTREVKEEAGFDIEIINHNKDNFQTKEAVTAPMPFITVIQDVNYPTGRHEHFDLTYLARPIGEQQVLRENESQEFGWFGEDELDGLEMFENVRIIIHKAIKSLK